jgi:signal transduction histidine kinase
MLPRERYVSWRRLLAGGVLLALLVSAGALALEWWRFGMDTAGALRRADTELGRDFDAMTSLLAELGSAVASDPRTTKALEDARELLGPPEASKALFEVLDTRMGAARDRPDVAVTIYDLPNAVARAWTGRPSDLPPDRVRSPQSWFVTPAPQGLRLVHMVPISANGAPIGVAVAEHALSRAAAAVDAVTPAEYLMPTRFGPASLVPNYEGAGQASRENAFLLRAPTGEVLVEASISNQMLAATRTAWRRRLGAVVLGVLTLTLLLLIGPLLDRRSAAGAGVGSPYHTYTVGAAVLVVAAAAVGWVALDLGFQGGPGIDTLLLVCSGATAGVLALLAAPVTRARAALRRQRRWPADAWAPFIVQQLIAGIVLAAALAIDAWILQATLQSVEVDLRHFSLHPWGTRRLTLLAAILTCQIATVWSATLVLVTALSRWRVPLRAGSAVSVTILLWLTPAVVLLIAAGRLNRALPALALLLSAAVCALAALGEPIASRWLRHATVAARILALFVPFWVPALLLYPAVNFYTDRAVRDVIASEYAVEARNHTQTLQERLAEARGEIDALPSLADLVTEGENPDPASPGTERAFFVWKQTALARYRLTSAIELYSAGGTLVSRFALNFPEYTGATQAPRPQTCEWDTYGEAARFGAEERRMLHSERYLCAGAGARLGAIVVHAVPDYRTLSFITSQSPYFEVFRTQGGAPQEGMTGSDVEIVIYGWGRTPLYASAGSAWPITDELFERIYRTRDPFWTEIHRGNGRWHVLVANDRHAVYALGYPALTVFDRFVHLAELTTLAGALFVVLLVATAFFTRVARERPRVGRALLREIRASFYRKLFLAFVLASIIPVLTLAFVIRAYFAGLLRVNVEAEAARSAAVAQRVIEESAALQGTEADPLPAPSATSSESTARADDVMIWISQVIDQDVNIFAGTDAGGVLLATSERDLFASGLLPTRASEGVYRAIVLQRLTSFVDEDRIGDFPYMIAATPVRVGDRDALLTVPLANQQREIEREVDEIDRGVHLAALFFILLGAGMGLSMAERIADPVRRLTRATRRIASGDFDARIAVRSADELRRLVDAFNSMAGELKAQRTQLERTHRLEAWAEMARQVAHEIKNPLTPIQLSAEHLRRVHADRGEPMGAVLEGCVTSILAQVRLLRQIASEFSNFASSPTARPAAVDLPELVAEVVDPYRTGLTGRIDINNHVTGPLPPVFVDRTLMGRALANIVENALHAMPGAGSLTLSAEPQPGEVVLRVKDSGVGMDEEALARVFEPYFSTKATGTGLGLPIARRNVELSGGRVEVESARGQGTTVILHLPTAESSTAPSTLS